MSDVGATIVYMFASPYAKPFNARVDATFFGDELRATLSDGARITYRMRKDESIDYSFRRGSAWADGVLSKVE